MRPQSVDERPVGVPVAFAGCIPLQAMGAPRDEWPAPNMKLMFAISV